MNQFGGKFFPRTAFTHQEHRRGGEIGGFHQFPQLLPPGPAGANHPLSDPIGIHQGIYLGPAFQPSLNPIGPDLIMIPDDDIRGPGLQQAPCLFRSQRTGNSNGNNPRLSYATGFAKKTVDFFVRFLKQQDTVAMSSSALNRVKNLDPDIAKRGDKGSYAETNGTAACFDECHNHSHLRADRARTLLVPSSGG